MAYGSVNVPGVSGVSGDTGATALVPVYVCSGAGSAANKKANETYGMSLKEGTIFAVWFVADNTAENVTLTIEGTDLPVISSYTYRKFTAVNIAAGIHLFMVFNDTAMLLNPATALTASTP